VVLVFTVSLFSASQDIVLDAYRRELLEDDELGVGNSFFVNTYKFASLVPGSLALILSDLISWTMTYWIVAAFMAVGLITTFIIKEVSDDALAPHTLRDAVIEPFREFINRDGLKSAMAILAFMFLYKLGDNMAVALQTPFYLDMGYSRTEIGSVAKAAALWSATAGGILGGVLMLRLSINRALWIFGFVQIFSILGYIWLSTAGHTLVGLFAVVSGEYLGVGLGAIALTAYIARATSLAFTATQFALFSSFIAIPRTFVNASTGFLIESMGYTHFFMLCTLVAIPGMLMLFVVAPWREPHEESAAGSVP
jgi:PAT family beta-lactamase induction signal transducer AmpG